MFSHSVVLILLAITGTIAFDSPNSLISTPEDINSKSHYGNTRIVNGYPAKNGQFPYQVGLTGILTLFKALRCGGSIISPEWILTAAHCTKKVISFVVLFGSVNVNKPESSMLTFDFIVHENYDPSNANNDIALIRLPEKLEYTNNVQPIMLPGYSMEHDTFENDTAVVSGFGRTSDKASGPSNTLNYAYVKVINNEDCVSAFNADIIRHFTLCVVGAESEFENICKGDSGGPLATDDINGRPTQIGVVSFVSSAGCEKGLPTGFVRVSYYLDWIHEKTKIPIGN